MFIYTYIYIMKGLHEEEAQKLLQGVSQSSCSMKSSFYFLFSSFYRPPKMHIKYIDKASSTFNKGINFCQQDTDLD